MEELSVEIRHADGRYERASTRSPRTVIGSGAHCDVRLAPDQAAFEHVVVETTAAGVLVRSLAAAPPATVGGRLLTAIPLGAGVDIRIGATDLRITRVVLLETPKARGGQAVMVAKLAVLTGLIGALAFVLNTNETDNLLTSPRPPELFGAAVAACPRTDLGEARAMAEDYRASGDGARERSPFDPREARAAIQNYEAASACYRIVQDGAAAEETAQNARRLREETVVDFRARRARLDRMLRLNDYELAAQDITVLRALTENQQGEYSQWLASVAQTVKNQQPETAK